MGTIRLMAIDEICQRGSVRDADVAMLSRAFSREPHLTVTDVESLFRINNLARVQDPTWPDFFIETLTDYVVREMEPAGYVTATQAGWLMARISTGGRVRTTTEFALLLNVIDKARWVPESLMGFALTQFRDAVVIGNGALRASGMIGAGVITSAEIEQVRRLLFAYGADRPTAITQVEADLLMDIDAAIVNDPIRVFRNEFDAWTDLFGKALANAVLSASGYIGPSREEALRETVALDGAEPGDATGGNDSRQDGRPDYRHDGRLALVTRPRGVLGLYTRSSGEATALAMLERQRIEIITGEPVTEANAARLALRLYDEIASDRARSTLRTIRRAGLELHPAIAPAVRAVGVAA